MPNAQGLPEAALKLAISNAVVEKMKLEDLIEKLWREDPEQVKSLYHSIRDNYACEGWQNPHGCHNSRVRKRKLPTRKKFGLTISQVASRTRIPKATLISLMEHHGLIELVQFGLDQQRRLVTAAAFKAELGHNVYTTGHIGHLEGFAKASPFPVFYEDRLEDITWMLDYPGIKRGLLKMDTKKRKLAWLLGRHAYLPDVEIAGLAGYSRYGVLKARLKTTSDQPKTTDKAA